MQRIFNNNSTNIEKSFTEIYYEFTFLRSKDFVLQLNLRVKSFLIKQFVENNIAHLQRLINSIYNNKHKFIQFRVNN